jgi:hypothetical protein
MSNGLHRRSDSALATRETALCDVRPATAQPLSPKQAQAVGAQARALIVSGASLYHRALVRIFLARTEDEILGAGRRRPRRAPTTFPRTPGRRA